jgi:hypothetical protein
MIMKQPFLHFVTSSPWPPLTFFWYILAILNIIKCLYFLSLSLRWEKSNLGFIHPNITTMFSLVNSHVCIITFLTKLTFLWRNGSYVTEGSKILTTKNNVFFILLSTKIQKKRKLIKNIINWRNKLKPLKKI